MAASHKGFILDIRCRQCGTNDANDFAFDLQQNMAGIRYIVLYCKLCKSDGSPNEIRWQRNTRKVRW